jgi:hypothetical protein
MEREYSMGVKEMEGEDVDWIQLVQDTDKWQALVNMVVTVRVSYKAGTFFGYLRIYQLPKKVSTPCI